MSGSGGDGTAATQASGLQGLLSKITGSGSTTPGASQFSADGSTPSQFTMPGGQIPQYQGAAMMPATLGGAQGVQDAQNWTQAVQDQSGMTAANVQQMLQKLGTAGNLAAPQQNQQQMARAPAGAHAASGQAQNFTPTQLQTMPTGPTQGTTNLQSPVGASTGQTQAVQNLMQLLKLGNSGFQI
jgi:hypothetical protein